MIEQRAFEPRLVLVTVPEMETGKRLARRLVEHKIAACVNLIPQVVSVYRWEGRVQEDSEIILYIKTSSALLDSLERVIKEMHPYETPEFIVLSALECEERYGKWWSESLG